MSKTIENVILMISSLRPKERENFIINLSKEELVSIKDYYDKVKFRNNIVDYIINIVNKKLSEITKEERNIKIEDLIKNVNKLH